jgi:cytochrome c biogenesis protein CcdA
MLGMIAAVNPCGFVLLPAYLLYFLGIDGANQGVTRAPLQRALRVSAAVSSGFLVVFLIVGSISRLFTQWIELNAKYAGFVIGIALIGLGIAMLFGWKPSFATSLPNAKKTTPLEQCSSLELDMRSPALVAPLVYSPQQFLVQSAQTASLLVSSAL